MPIALSPIGTLMDASIIDGNFEELQKFLQGKIDAADIATTNIRRWRIRQYTGGKIERASVFSNPPIYTSAPKVTLMTSVAQLDIPYIEKTEDCGLPAAADNRIEGVNRPAYEMELLGKPGPSFYYSFQLDGISEATVTTYAPAFPPASWPPDRYSEEYCYSRFLTVPGATIRVWVPEPCIIRVKAHARCTLDTFQKIGVSKLNANPGYASTILTNHANKYRFVLVADTNPTLHADEFANANPNIIDPVTGAMATRCSWKIFEDITVSTPQKTNVQVWGEVALKGGRYYNISLKYTDGFTHGFVSKGVWDPGIWERSLVGPIDFYPAWVNMFESGSLDIEFIYKRETAYIADSTDPELN